MREGGGRSLILPKRTAPLRGFAARRATLLERLRRATRRMVALRAPRAQAFTARASRETSCFPFFFYFSRGTQIDCYEEFLLRTRRRKSRNVKVQRPLRGDFFGALSPF